MIPTGLGIVAGSIAILMILLARPPKEFLILLLASAVLGTAEAVRLPSLGGASLVVPFFIVPFFAVRIALARPSLRRMAIRGITANKWIILYACLAAIAAAILPQLFQGTMDVVSMRPLLYRVPLAPSPQNITQSVYIALSAIVAVCAYTAAQAKKSTSSLAEAVLAASGFYVFFALVDVGTFYAGIDGALDWARSASYALLSQSELGVRRISGSFTEPSTFASFGFPLLSFFSACWLYGIRQRGSSACAIILAVVLALSTSSTAYGCLAVLVVALFIGVLLLPGVTRRLEKLLALGLLALLSTLAIITLAAIFPQQVQPMLTVIERMTFSKAQSSSAIERAYWAQQGYLAFSSTWGLGVGPGSFRSSGLVPAVLGSVGLAGALLLCAYCFSIVRILSRPQTNGKHYSHPAAFAAICSLVAPTLSSASSDPGLLFAVFSGFALGRDALQTRSRTAAGGAAIWSGQMTQREMSSSGAHLKTD